MVLLHTPGSPVRFVRHHLLNNGYKLLQARTLSERQYQLGITGCSNFLLSATLNEKSRPLKGISQISYY
jgi:hypothetical protein